MNRFNLSAQLSRIYGGDQLRPGGPASPVIGITANYGEQNAKLADGYYKQVVAAGGTPLIIPPLADEASLLATLDRIDGLLLSGGADINPLYMNQEPQPQLGGINDERDLPELLITRDAGRSPRRQGGAAHRQAHQALAGRWPRRAHPHRQHRP